MKQRAKGIVLNYITMAFKLGVGLLYTPFMLSKIGDSEYGILSIANSFIVFLTILDCGFGQTLIRYQTKNLVQKNKDEQATNQQRGPREGPREPRRGNHQRARRGTRRDAPRRLPRRRLERMIWVDFWILDRRSRGCSSATRSSSSP